MREVIIDLWRSSRFNMGYVGENEATKLIFQLTPDLQGADFYSIDFLVGDAVKSVSGIKVDDEFLSYIVPSTCTALQLNSFVLTQRRVTRVYSRQKIGTLSRISYR